LIRPCSFGDLGELSEENLLFASSLGALGEIVTECLDLALISVTF
jgi:hypothetical protein